VREGRASQWSREGLLRYRERERERERERKGKKRTVELEDASSSRYRVFELDRHDAFFLLLSIEQ
jgi:hypothetical protein